MDDVIRIKKNEYNRQLKFSICTIVNDMHEYSVMQNSFKQNGFLEDCEYVIADNTNGNEFDAYESISYFLKVAQGEFIIVVHQDVRLIDNYTKLVWCLNDLQNKDKKWAVCGNAGAKGYHQSVLHIAHKSHKEVSVNLPIKVNSLDENFLILKSSSNITISSDLKGFHLYGTDLCIIAQFLGYNCYVIEFMLLHLSEGNIKSLKKTEHEFIEQYGEKMNFGYLQTTCTQFYLSNSKKKNKLLNKPFFFFILKQFERYPWLIKKWKRKLKGSFLF